MFCEHCGGKLHVAIDASATTDHDVAVVFSDTSTGSPTAWVAALGAVWRRGGEYGAKPDACLHLWCPPSRGAIR
ncbi:MAG: hypothetical protein H6668_04555 [Ardenticatenaceae bacterium]|nr:hypothetical protein [Ardenticatenaceae bacterium]